MARITLRTRIRTRPGTGRGRRSLAAAFALAFLAAWGCSRAPRPVPLTPEDRELHLQSFDYVWETIRDKHWDPTLNGIDWEAVRDSLRPKVQEAFSRPEARRSMEVMIEQLGQSHFGIIPVELYTDMATPEGGGAMDGWPGFETRILENDVVVTRIEPESPAEEAGVRTGWIVKKVRDVKLPELVARLQEELDESACATTNMAVMGRFRGPLGETLPVVFEDGAGKEVKLEIGLASPRGELAEFGNLPSTHVWYDARILDGDVVYFAFNFFLDPGRIMGAYNEILSENLDAQGVIVDLRGNVGGIGAMAMGMSGWFLEERGRNLGTMYLRSNEMKFTVSPRALTFEGPVAILTDCLSASTSEIMAGGLKDLGRARIFGSRTAGAALPSNIERLPNGDGFQYALANYISFAGDVLEGNGVEPTDPVPLVREELLQGRDPVLEAGLDWIRSEN